MKAKRIESTSSADIFQSDFGVQGRHAQRDKQAHQKYRSSGPSHRHARKRRFHPFRWFLESIALVLGLSVSMVIFAILGGFLLILAIMGPVMVEFFGT